MHTIKLRKHFLNAFLLLGIPFLWLGVSAFDFAPAPPQSMEFLPVVIRPFSSANYGVDKFTQSVAPIDLDIIQDAHSDRALPSFQATSTSPEEDNQGLGDENGNDDNPPPINPPHVTTPAPTNPAPTNPPPTNPAPTNPPPGPPKNPGPP
ncbi:MAG: hypothetical protein WD740_01495, partial [Anaerolineales bacterium]